MHEWFCGRTAFHCHRTPPQLKCLMPLFPDIGYPKQKLALKRQYNDACGWKNVLGPLPLDTIVSEPDFRRKGAVIQPHLWSGEPPSPSFYDDPDLGISYASPQFTLLTMATQLSVVQLAMAMYEMCGSFAVFQPSKDLQKALDRIEPTRLRWPGGWKQVMTTKGEPTSLWKRDPLVELPDLYAYAQHLDGIRGAKNYRAALELITGSAASPLEARLSMLLSLPRSRGGEEFPAFINNQRIDLSSSAARLAGKSTCYADLYFPETEEHPAIDVECQGRAVHAGDQQSEADANRATAIQIMNIEVIQVTHAQIMDERSFETFCDYLAHKLQVKRAPKTTRMATRAQTLRSEVLGSWDSLGGGL